MAQWLGTLAAPDEGLGRGSQQPHVHLQPSATPARDASGFRGHQTHTWCTYMQVMYVCMHAFKVREIRTDLKGTEVAIFHLALG